VASTSRALSTNANEHIQVMIIAEMSNNGNRHIGFIISVMSARKHNHPEQSMYSHAADKGLQGHLGMHLRSPSLDSLSVMIMRKS
jgi:hypothetical protein